MGVRSYVELEVQCGLDNSLDDAAYERTITQLLDTLEHVTQGVVTLGALAQSVQLPFSGVTNARIVYLECENGDIGVSFGGVAATAAAITGSMATYPTGFVGSETLGFEIDGSAVAVVFDSADQSLAQVCNRINAACVLLGIALVATPSSGQLRITSPTLGEASTVEILAGGTALAVLGLSASTATGTNSTTGAAPIQVRRPADPTGASAAAGVNGIFYGTVKTTSVYVDNLSDNETKLHYMIVGDLTPDT